MKRLSLAIVFAVGWIGAVFAQSNPGFIYGQVPTAAQWNNAFSQKQDILGYVPINRAGDSMLGRLSLFAPSAGGAGLNVGVGTAPSSPHNGDMWLTTSGLYYQTGGSTFGPITSAVSVAPGKTLTVNHTGIINGGDAWVLAIAAAKTLTASNSITIAGTDGKTITVSNNLTFAGTDGSTLNVGAGGTIGAVGYATTGQIPGTATNDNASAGKVGEYIEATQTSFSNFNTSAQFGDLGSLALTAGDWDLSMLLVAQPNGATVASIEAGFGTVTGNSATGVVLGVNASAQAGPTVSTDTAVSVPAYRVSLSGSTTYYCKVLASYSVATPQYVGRCSARRIR